MKKHIILAAVAALATLTACSNDEEEPQVPGAEVNFTISGPSAITTKTTTSDSGLTSFVENDKITIYSKGLQTNMQGAEYNVAADGKTLTPPSGSSYKFDGTKGATFYAYYPTTSTHNATEATFIIAANQSTTDDFNKNDLMTAVTELNVAKQNVELQFNHRMGLFLVDVSNLTSSKTVGGNTVSTTVKSVVVNNVYPTVNWNYATNTVTTSTTGSAIDVAMGLNSSSNNNNLYWAIIPAQTLGNNNALLTITISETTTPTSGGDTTTTEKIFDYIPASGLTITENNVTKLILKFAGNYEVSATASINNWTNFDATGQEIDVAEYALIPTVYDTTPISTLNSITELSIGHWGTVFTNTSFVATAKTIDGGFEIIKTAEGSGSSWSNRTLVYKNRKKLDSTKKYKLSFDISCVNSGDGSNITGQVWLWVGDGNTNFYSLRNFSSTITKAVNDGTRMLVNINKSKETWTIYIDPAKFISNYNATDSSSGWTSTDENNNFQSYIGIAFHGTNVPAKYTITNISLTEEELP